jgi:hypothetical protein
VIHQTITHLLAWIQRHANRIYSLHSKREEKTVPIPDSISNYLRLCGRQHKRKYVGISVMLSCFIKCLPFSLLPAVIAT